MPKRCALEDLVANPRPVLAGWDGASSTRMFAICDQRWAVAKAAYGDVVALVE